MSEQVSAADKGSFFSLLGHSFQIMKQHWLTFLVLVIISFAVTTFSVMVAIGAGFGFALTGGTAGTMLIMLIVSLIIAAASVFIGLSTLRVVHFTVLNHEVKISEILSYSLKNFFSFIWATIVGVIYAMRWGLLLVLGVPVAYAIMNLMARQIATTESGIASAPLAILGTLNFVLAILGLIGIVIFVLAAIRIVFLGMAFVADDKRDTVAAKMSIELVKGRWLKTFGYFFFAGLLLTIGQTIVVSILSSIVGLEIGEIVSTVLAQVFGIVIIIFSALLYHSYKKA